MLLHIRGSFLTKIIGNEQKWVVLFCWGSVRRRITQFSFGEPLEWAEEPAICSRSSSTKASPPYLNSCRGCNHNITLSSLSLHALFTPSLWLDQMSKDEWMGNDTTWTESGVLQTFTSSKGETVCYFRSRPAGFTRARVHFGKLSVLIRCLYLDVSAKSSLCLEVTSS